MNDTACEWLAVLALDALGERVRVVTLEGDSKALGRAGWQDGSWVVRLDPGLRGEAALGVFYHELGHIALGHVPKGADTTPPTEPVTGLDVASAALAAPILAAREAEAEAWATEHLALLGNKARKLALLLL